MRGKSWLCTYNNPTKEFDALYTERQDKINYMVGQLEKGNNGTHHFQFFVQFTTQQRLSFFKNWDKNIHAEVAKFPEDAIKYCQKEDTRQAGPWCFGAYLDAGRKCHNCTVELLAKKSITELAGELDPIRYNAAIKAVAHFQVHKKVKMSVNPDMKTKGLWIQGKPGVGKSYAVRKKWGDSVYLKAQNKWWDGYSGQDYALIDDFDKNGALLSHHLKIWADAYDFTGEVKGATLPISLKYMIITSNYLPGDIWETDPVLLEAIERRFQIIQCDLDNREKILESL